MTINTKTTKNPLKKIVIVGGGFGGVKAALELSGNKQLAVTLISDRPNFRYNPTLYRSATGGLMRQSSILLDDILDNTGVQRVEAVAVQIDRVKKAIITKDGGEYHYDKLILAMGVVTNYFGIPGLDKYSYGITSVREIQRFKSHLHKLLENNHKPDLNYLIIGGGPTGVELAGALPAYLRHIMKSHHIAQKRLNVQIIEAAPRLLPRSAPSISKAVCKRLQKLGVKVSVGQGVKGELVDGLLVGDKKILSQTVVWAAGTANNPFYKQNAFMLNDKSQVVVDFHLQAEKDVYVIGDNANTPFAGLAQTAVYDGHYVARDIEAWLRAGQHRAYRPKQPATVIPVGSHWAAFEYRSIRFTGFLGWMIRRAADWIGYHDLQTWWKANSQWMTEFGEEEDCATCNKT